MFAPREEFGHPHLWVFDLDSGVWTELNQEGEPPKWVEFPCTFVYSGRLWYLDYMQLRSRTAFIFSLHSFTWERVSLNGDPPGGGKNRDYVCVCSCYHKHFMYFYGGKPRERCVHTLDVREFVWEKRASIADPPNPANTHSMCVQGNNLCVVTQRKATRKRDVSIFTMDLSGDDWVMEKRLVEIGRIIKLSDPLVIGSKWYWLEAKHDLSVFEFDFETYEPLEVFPFNGELQGSRNSRACVVDSGIIILFGWTKPRPPGENLHTPAEFFERAPVVQALVEGCGKRTEDLIVKGLSHDVALMFDDPVTSDVVLRIKDTEIAAHRSILASRSSFFRNTFYGVSEEVPQPNKSKRAAKATKFPQNLSERDDNSSFIELDTITHTPRAVLFIMRVIYGRTEECPEDWNELVDLMEAAGFYGVTGLGALCAETMERMLDKESVWEAVKFSQDLKSESLWIACRDFAELHWDEVGQISRRIDT